MRGLVTQLLLLTFTFYNTQCSSCSGALETCDAKQSLVVIQCDSSRGTGDLIACARYRIYDLKAKATEKLTNHVLFVIHLPRNVANSSFVGFQGNPWVSFYIDDLRPTNDIAISVGEAIGMTISELFNAGGKTSSTHEESSDELNSSEEEQGATGFQVSPAEPPEMGSASSVERAPIETARYRRLHGCIQAAASKLKDTTKRCTERLTLLVRLIPKVSPGQHSKTLMSTHISVGQQDLFVRGVFFVIYRAYSILWNPGATYPECLTRA